MHAYVLYTSLSWFPLYTEIGVTTPLFTWQQRVAMQRLFLFSWSPMHLLRQKKLTRWVHNAVLCNICMHNICNIYSVVGRFISNICVPRPHIYRGANRRGKYTAEVVYRGRGLTYRTRTYIYYIVWWLRNRQTFCLKKLPKTMPFSPGPYIADIGPPHNA